MLTTCGVNCQKNCKAYGDNCEGCNQLKGAVPWVSFIGADTCPIYACAKENNYISCGECAKIPCSIWLVDTRHPSLNDTEFEKDISIRLDDLKRSDLLK